MVLRSRTRYGILQRVTFHQQIIARLLAMNHGDGVGRCGENVSPFTFVLLKKTYP
jgi:hypothetical protein